MAGFMKLRVWKEEFAWECTMEDGETACLEPGWFAWYSAPGYMDRTDPCGPFETPCEALEACWETFGNEDDPDDVAEFEHLMAIAAVEAPRG